MSPRMLKLNTEERAAMLLNNLKQNKKLVQPKVKLGILLPEYICHLQERPAEWRQNPSRNNSEELGNYSR